MTTNATGQPGGPAAAAPGHDLPEWFGKLPEDVRTKYFPEDIQKDLREGYMRTADYTKKTQEIADLRKIREQYPQLNLAEAVEVARTWSEWREKQWPVFEQEYTANRARIAELEAQIGGKGAAPVTGKPGRHYEVAVEDFYETERLQTALGRLEDEIAGRVSAARDEWWQKTQGPVVEKMAQNYLTSVLGLLEPIWDRVFKDEGATMSEVLREAAARQNRNFGEVMRGIVTARGETRKGGYDEGYKKGLEEAAGKNGTAAAGTERTGPLGGGSPSWRPPDKTLPKTKDELRDIVLRQVESRKGPLPL